MLGVAVSRKFKRGRARRHGRVGARGGGRFYDNKSLGFALDFSAIDGFGTRLGQDGRHRDEPRQLNIQGQQERGRTSPAVVIVVVIMPVVAHKQLINSHP